MERYLERIFKEKFKCCTDSAEFDTVEQAVEYDRVNRLVVLLESLMPDYHNIETKELARNLLRDKEELLNILNDTYIIKKVD